MALPIYQLLYVSEHDNPVTEGGFSTTIYDIGIEATARNQTLDVTGFLICTTHWFAQILEGREAVIEDLMSRIAQDPRHHSLRILSTEYGAVRLFPNWSMGIATHDFGNRLLFLQHGLSPRTTPTEAMADNLIQLAKSLSRVRV